MRDLDWSDVVADGERAAYSTNDSGTHKTLDAAISAMDVFIEDVIGDNPGLSADDVAYDAVLSVAFDCEEEIGRELCRTQLGFVPDSLRWET
jgi:hypothetical protein